jgi:hypothetical protein
MSVSKNALSVEHLKGGRGSGGAISGGIIGGMIGSSGGDAHNIRNTFNLNQSIYGLSNLAFTIILVLVYLSHCNKNKSFPCNYQSWATFIFMFVLIFCLTFVPSTIFYFATVEEREIKVTKKDSTRYMIMDDKNNFYSFNNESYLFMYTADQIYMTIEEGKSYKIKVHGFENSARGMYKNIVSVEEMI